jgi:hypothetical protein
MKYIKEEVKYIFEKNGFEYTEGCALESLIKEFGVEIEKPKSKLEEWNEIYKNLEKRDYIIFTAQKAIEEIIKQKTIYIHKDCVTCIHGGKCTLDIMANCDDTYSKWKPKD